MTFQRICLIGGSGFIGGHIAAELARHDLALTIATRRRERSKGGLAELPRAELVEANVYQSAELDALLAGHDAVISMAGILHGSPAQFQRVHAELPQAIIAACKRQGVRRLVHISALGAAPDAPSDYQQSKAAGEKAVRESGLDWTILRPSVVFGAGDRFLNMFADLQALLPVLPLAGASTRFAPIWAADVARAAAACLERPATIGQALDLAGPRVYTLAELARYAGRLAGCERPLLPLPESLAMLQAALMEMLPGPALLSRDNIRSLRRDNVSPQPFPAGLLGFEPTALEAVAPAYLGDRNFNDIVSRYREQATR